MRDIRIKSRITPRKLAAARTLPAGTSGYETVVRAIRIRSSHQKLRPQSRSLRGGRTYRRRHRGALVVPGKYIGSNTFARRPDALAVGSDIVYCILCVGYAERPRRVNAQFVAAAPRSRRIICNTQYHSPQPRRLVCGQRCWSQYISLERPMPRGADVCTFVRLLGF